MPVDTAPIAEQAVSRRHIGRVLVVDDHPANRLTLQTLLEPQGHTVIEAADGPSALALAQAERPDVTLLDVQMPGLDGFEVCRRLKADHRTAATPVLLVTALDAREDRLTGIRAGADDFITKPVDGADLTLRVRNHIAAHALLLETRAQLEQLRELEAMRDLLVHFVVHDLRSPLTSVMANLEMLRSGAAAPDDSAEMLTDALEGARRMAGLVGDVLDMSRLDARQMPLAREPVDMSALVDEARGMVAEGRDRVQHLTSGMPVSVDADRNLLLRVVMNLVDNALKFTPAPGVVRVSVAAEAGGVTVRIRDNGPGIAPEAQALIFDKFGQVGAARQARRSSGLGLAFCKMAVEAHGGRIGVASDAEHGSEFWFSIPAA